MTHFGNSYTKNKKKIISSKPSSEVTITSKKFWVILSNRDKLVYDKLGHLLIFPRRRDALEHLEMLNNINYKIEKLDVIITK